MSDDSIARHEVLFYEALELPVPDRHRFLDKACGADGDLRAEVEELLQAHEGAADFLRQDGPASLGGEGMPERVQPERPGDRIGPYKLLEQIGEGGFGVVWVAEQEKPVRRRVALKIIKPGMDTREVIARFEQERQALAMMDHPNIARVLDAAATPLGRPYFVMELVRGTRITEFCDKAKLSTADRLRIFIAVCHAVQHAHQKGIIHRDLKPSNILVTLHDGVPVPKVIDFGIAKATQQQRLTDLTIYTRFEQMIGTPLYMSPEQAEMSGLDVDTRSDIYSLGVLLYELLVGRTPFDPETLMKRGLDEIRRVVREQEPQKPSTFVSTMALDLRTDVAQHRQTDGAKLIGQIRGDLDWIVMKALEKDRVRRYETANNLAEDIQRHLGSEPVTARPATQFYRFRRFAKRNKIAFAAVAGIAAALLIGMAVSTWMFFKEKQARERAVAAERAQQSEASKSQQVATFLIDMLKGVRPAVALGRDTTVLREILDSTAERVGKDLQDQPEVEAELRSNIGLVYLALGEFEKAATMHRAALDLRRKVFGEPHIKISDSLAILAIVMEDQGKPTEAEKLHRESLAMRRKLMGNDDTLVADSLVGLASALREQGKYTDAEAMSREALATARKALGGDHLTVCRAITGLGWTLSVQRRDAEAEPLMREALEMKRRLHGNDHPLVSQEMGNLAAVLTGVGKAAEAESLLREVLARDRKLYSREHPAIAHDLNNLAMALDHQGKPVEAETLHREALAMRRKVFGDVHPSVADSLNNLAIVLVNQGRSVEAEVSFREALALQRKLFGDLHPDVADGLNNLAMLLQDQWRFDEVEALRREELAIRRKIVGDGQSRLPQSFESLAELQEKLLKWQDAEPLRRELLDAARTAAPPVPGALDLRINGLAHNLYRQERFAEAEPLYRELLQSRQARQPTEPGKVASGKASLGRMLADWVWSGRSSETGAIKLKAEVAERARESERLLRDALAFRMRESSGKESQVAETRSRLGGSVLAAALTDPSLDDTARAAKLAQAESLLVESVRVLNEGDAEIQPIYMRDALTRLVRLYETFGKQDKAREWQQAVTDLNGLEVRFLRAKQLQHQGKAAETVEILREILREIRAVARRSVLSVEPMLEISALELAEMLRAQNRFAEAEALYREAKESRRARLPADNQGVLGATASLGRILAEWAWSERAASFSPQDAKPEAAGRAREAEHLLRECLATRLRGPGSTHWRTGDVRSRLGGALVAVAVTDPAPASEDRSAVLAEAETLLLQGNEVLQQGQTVDRKYKRESISWLVRLYEAWNKPDKAAEWQIRLDEFKMVEAKPKTGAKHHPPGR